MQVSNVTPCAQCHRLLDHPKWCINCGARAYCSRECQVANWKNHKIQCDDLYFNDLLGPLGEYIPREQCRDNVASDKELLEEYSRLMANVMLQVRDFPSAVLHKQDHLDVTLEVVSPIEFIGVVCRLLETQHSSRVELCLVDFKEIHLLVRYYLFTRLSLYQVIAKIPHLINMQDSHRMLKRCSDYVYKLIERQLSHAYCYLGESKVFKEMNLKEKRRRVIQIVCSDKVNVPLQIRSFDSSLSVTRSAVYMKSFLQMIRFMLNQYSEEEMEDILTNDLTVKKFLLRSVLAIAPSSQENSTQRFLHAGYQTDVKIEC